MPLKSICYKYINNYVNIPPLSTLFSGSCFITLIPLDFQMRSILEWIKRLGYRLIPTYRPICICTRSLPNNSCSYYFITFKRLECTCFMASSPIQSECLRMLSRKSLRSLMEASLMFCLIIGMLSAIRSQKRYRLTLGR